MNDIKPMEYNNQRILTTEQLAESYETSSELIGNNFRRNRERYKIEKHYYCLESDDLRAFRATHQIDGLPSNLNKLYLWTERGAFLHAKSLNNDTAWEIYERLVDTYFQYQELKQELVMQNQLKAIQNSLVESFAKRMELESDAEETLVKATRANYLGLMDINTLKETEQRIQASNVKKRIYDSGECVRLLQAAAELVEKDIIHRDVEYQLMKFQGFNAIAFGTCFYDSLICNLSNIAFSGDIPSRFTFLESLERKKYFLGYIPLPKGVPYRDEHKWIVLNLDLLSQKMKVLKFGFIPLR